MIVLSEYQAGRTSFDNDVFNFNHSSKTYSLRVGTIFDLPNQKHPSRYQKLLLGCCFVESHMPYNNNSM